MVIPMNLHQVSLQTPDKSCAGTNEMMQKAFETECMGKQRLKDDTSRVKMVPDLLANTPGNINPVQFSVEDDHQLTMR